MGSSLALFLARRGAQVTLIDAAARPFSGASRWNEGKIHLGYLYAGDPTLATARKVLPGGLAFRPLVEELVGSLAQDEITPADDIYLVHRASVVSAEAMSGYAQAVSQLVRDHPDAKHYLADACSSRPAVLDARSVEAIAGSPDIVAGVRVPERSVHAPRLADRFVQAITAETRIEGMYGQTVVGASINDGHVDVALSSGGSRSFDLCVNALWNGRLGIDQTTGLFRPEPWSYRYRLSLFLRTRTNTSAPPSVVIATGPFGDIKNYNGRDFYLSWYQAGLVAEAEGLVAPPLPPRDAGADEDVTCRTLQALQRLIPATAALAADRDRVTVQGGWVVADGAGSLADPRSSLHRRDRFGIIRYGQYVSVDTGKYSTAPWLARQLADMILD